MNYEENDYDFENRMIAPEYMPEDGEVENPLRPRTLSDYVGQEKAKENLAVFIEAARLEGIPGSRFAVWPSWFGKNHLGGDYRQ